MSFESEMIEKYNLAIDTVKASDEYDSIDHSKTAWMNAKLGGGYKVGDSISWRRRIAESKEFLKQYGDYCKRIIAETKNDKTRT